MTSFNKIFSDNNKESDRSYTGLSNYIFTYVEYKHYLRDILALYQSQYSHKAYQDVCKAKFTNFT